MSDRGALALLAVLMSTAGALAEPAVTLLDLPFTARAMRGPGSAVSVSVATSGLLTLARPKRSDPKATLGAEPEDAPVTVVWGDGGGAALSLRDGRIETTLIGAEAIEGLIAAETPRGALPGSRGAVLGPVSAHLAASASGPSLTIRERQPVAMSAEPKAVPIATHPVQAGSGAAFAPARPHAARAGAATLVFGVIAQGDGAVLAAVGKTGTGWEVLGRTPPQAGGDLDIAAVAASAGDGPVRVATVLAPGGRGLLQLWAWEAGAFRLLGEAPGLTDRGAGAAQADLAALVDTDGDGRPELALASSDRGAVVVLGLTDGFREGARIALPAPAGFGLSALGRGPKAPLLVGLADGRVAVIAP
ncbi:hypothetical protein ASG40_19020 [Methylobacterium sp. Leaf399]|uniref:hypothetical protein n=1 Tax=Methylobacterium sp. Leaf399 TaxID=1736364 RepID=UPI0006F9723D|nr:hypothetical protein [Methylobacterium sp. Leaf399]KQT15157.1 hypothetical protein ASG40_19020 [Methylobacterium sp. Leaf399]